MTAVERPRVVCLCGSLRFAHLFESERRRLTAEGVIVLAPEAIDGELTPARRAALAELHLRRIDLADEIRVVSEGGYVGEATRREIAYARRRGTRVTAVEPTLLARVDDVLVEKVAWVLLRDGRILVTRNDGRDLFSLPGGRREPGETDRQTLVREIDEELQTDVDGDTMAHVGTFDIPPGHPEHGPFRMFCYTADHRGDLVPSHEIAEKAWFGYADRARVSVVDGMVFDALHTSGRLR